MSECCPDCSPQDTQDKKKTQRNAESFASTRSRGRQMGFAANL